MPLPVLLPLNGSEDVPYLQKELEKQPPCGGKRSSMLRGLPQIAVTRKSRGHSTLISALRQVDIT